MTFREAAALVEVEKSKAYADAHGWVFVPASFELIVLQLARLGLTDWRIERIDVAASTEFLVWLVKGAKAELAGVPEGVFSEMRHALLEESLLQLDAQSLQFSIKDRLRRLLGRRRNPLGSTNRRRE